MKHGISADFDLPPVYSMLMSNQAMLYAIMETQAEILAILNERPCEAEFEKLVERVEEEYNVVHEFFRHNFPEQFASPEAEV